MQQKFAVTHGQSCPGLPVRFLWVTVFFGPLTIAYAFQDVIPLLAIFLAQKLFKQVKIRHNDARTFGVVPADLVLVRFERVSPNLKSGLDGTFFVLLCCFVGFVCTLATCGLGLARIDITVVRGQIALGLRPQEAL